MNKGAWGATAHECYWESDEWSNSAHTMHESKDEITKKLRKYFKLNNKEYTEYQNLWDAAKDVLR